MLFCLFYVFAFVALIRGHDLDNAESEKLPCVFIHRPVDGNVAHKFNLCPLLRPNPGSSELRLSVSTEQATPPTHMNYRYDFALGGSGLPKNVTLPAELQCPDGTWICLTVINTRPDHPSEPPRILQVVPIASADASKAPLFSPYSNDDTTASHSHSGIRLFLFGGSYASLAQKALISFECETKSNSIQTSTSRLAQRPLHNPPEIKFTYYFNNTYFFSARSTHACPLTIPAGPPPSRPTESESPPENTPPPEPVPDEEKDVPTSPGRGLSFETVLALWLILIIAFIILQRLRRLRSRSRRHVYNPLTWFATSSSPLTTTAPSPRFQNLGKGTPWAAYEEVFDADGDEVALAPFPGPRASTPERNRKSAGYGLRYGGYGAVE